MVPVVMAGVSLRLLTARRVLRGYRLLRICRLFTSIEHDNQKRIVSLLRSAFPNQWLRQRSLQHACSCAHHVQNDDAIVVLLRFNEHAYDDVRTLFGPSDERITALFNVLQNEMQKYATRYALELIQASHGEYTFVGNVGNDQRRRGETLETLCANALRFLYDASASVERMFKFHTAWLPANFEMPLYAVVHCGSLSCAIPGMHKMFYGAWGECVDTAVYIMNTAPLLATRSDASLLLCTHRVAENVSVDEISNVVIEPLSAVYAHTDSLRAGVLRAKKEAGDDDNGGGGDDKTDDCVTYYGESTNVYSVAFVPELPTAPLKESRHSSTTGADTLDFADSSDESSETIHGASSGQRSVVPPLPPTPPRYASAEE
jgi:hypothetical protein